MKKSKYFVFFLSISSVEQIFFPLRKITHFHIKFDSKSYVDVANVVTITGIQVEGLLIKRK